MQPFSDQFFSIRAQLALTAAVFTERILAKFVRIGC
jgi:hypothetical protein